MPPGPRTFRPNHHDLKSFLAYAERTGLDPKSSVFIGTRYEYVALASLARFGLSLERVGRRDDRGIDLRGTWHPPCLVNGRTLSIIGQCKRTGNEKPGPRFIRELEGTFAGDAGSIVRYNDHANPESQSILGGHDQPHVDVTNDTIRGPSVLDALALLATPSTATKGIRDAMGRSRWPLIYTMIREDGSIQQFLWNKKAADIGLEGLRVETRYTPTVDDSATGDLAPPLATEAVLTWNGEPWPPGARP